MLAKDRVILLKELVRLSAYPRISLEMKIFLKHLSKIYEEGREQEIEHYCDLDPKHKEYKDLTKTMEKKMKALDKNLKNFYKTKEGKKSIHRLCVAPDNKHLQIEKYEKPQEKVSLSSVREADRREPRAWPERTKSAGSEDSADNLKSPGIGHLTIQNSHGVTIAGRDVHIYGQTRKRTQK